jgi:hypothetical protein
MNCQKNVENINQGIKPKPNIFIKKFKVINVNIIISKMLPRFILKRFCHSTSTTPITKSKCYENTHHLYYLRQDINELKNMLYSYNEPVRIMYFANIFTFGGTLFLLLKN